MTMLAVTLRAFRPDWVAILRRTKKASPLVFAFAVGGWAVSIRDHAASLPYFERSAKSLEAVHQAVGPNPIATVKCARHQTSVALHVAGQAVISNYDTDIPVPSLSVIPKCPQ